MNYDEKLQSKPEDFIDHEQLDNLNRQLADKLALLRDAGVDVDSCSTNVSPDTCLDLFASFASDFYKNFPPVVKK